MPFWDIYLKFPKTQDEQLMNIVYQVAQKLISADPNSFEFELLNLDSFSRAVLCCRSALLQYSEFDPARQVLDKLIQVLHGFLSSHSLDKRVAATSFLSKEAEMYLCSEAVFSKDFRSLVSQYSIVDLVINPVHTEILKRCNVLLRLLATTDELSEDSVRQLWTGAVQGHESTRACTADVLAQLAPYLPDHASEVIRQELEATPVSSFDSQFLTFITKVLRGLPEKSTKRNEIAEIFFEKLKDPAIVERAAALRTQANLLTLPMFSKNAKEMFSERLANLTQESAEYLNLFLASLSMTQSLDEFFAPPPYLANMCIEAMDTALQQTNTALILELLKCLDKVASFSSKLYFTPDQMLRLWRLFVRRPYQARLLFEFLHENDVSWITGIIGNNFLGLLDDLSDDTCVALSMLTKRGYKGLRKVFTANIWELDYLSSSTNNGVKVITAVPILVSDAQTKSLSTVTLLRYLTVDKYQIEPQCLWCILRFLKEPQWESGALKLLQSISDFQEKYRSALLHDDDFQECVKRIAKEKPEWNDSELFPDEKAVIERKVKTTMILSQQPYFCVRMMEGKKMLDTRRFDMQLLSNLCRNEKLIEALITILKSSKNSSESILAWTALSRFLPGSTYLSLLSRDPKKSKDLQSSSDFTKRLIWLLCISLQPVTLRSAQLKKDIAELFDRLDFDASATQILSHFSFRFVVYCELLVKMMGELFWKANERTGTKEVKKLISILIFVSEYFFIPEMDKSLEVRIFHHSLSLFRTKTDINWDMNSQELDQLLVNSLILSESKAFRVDSCRFFEAMCEFKNSMITNLVDLLVDNLEKAFEGGKKSIELFILFSNLLSKNPFESESDISGFMQKFISFAMNEDIFWGLDEDFRVTLLNTLRIMWKLIEKDAKKQVSTTLIRWLFSFQERYRDNSKPGIRTVSAALALISNLADNDDLDIIQPVIDLLNVFHRDRYSRSLSSPKWLYSSRGSSLKPFLGLKNLGATCYMSSMLQQLFHIPTFRDSLLSCERVSGAEVLNNLITVFTQLKFKGKGSVSPREMFTSLDGVVGSASEQMDIEEFFNGFVVRLEADLGKAQLADLGKAQLADLVRYHFKGKQMRTLKCKGGCGNEKEISEEFLTLTLGIKGKKTLKASLEAMVQGELMGGDNAILCEKCGKSEQTESFHRILTLPKIVIMSFRRFEYSMEKGSRHKINEKFEFPPEIDLKPYCVNSDLPEDYYQFTLRGVVIHGGSADSGHYYSVVKCEGTWMRFNDTIINSEVDNIDKEFFGKAGSDKNAYLVIYERMNFYTDDPLSTQSFTMSVSQPSTDVQAMGTELQEGMRKHWQFEQLRSSQYEDFVKRLLTKDRMQSLVLKFAISYFLTIHVRMERWSQSLVFISALLSKISQTPSIAYWVLEVLTHPSILDEFLLTNAPSSVQKSFLLLLEESMRVGTDAVVHSALLRLLYRMSLLHDCTRKHACGLLEAVLLAVKRSRSEASNLHTLEYVTEKALSQNADFQEIVPWRYLFSEEAYLGYGTSEYKQCYLPTTSETRMGFQFMIVNFLFSENHLSQVYYALEKELNNGRMYATYFERKSLCTLLKSIFDVNSAAAGQLVSAWASKLSLREESDIRKFFEIVILLAQLTNGNLLSPILEKVFASTPSSPIPRYTVPLLVDYLYFLFKQFPQVPVWNSEVTGAALQCWRSSVDDRSSDSLRYLQALITKEAPLEIPSLPQPKSYYSSGLSEQISLQVKINKQDKVGRLEKSFKIVHVVRLQSTNRLSWVPGEEDIKIL